MQHELIKLNNHLQTLFIDAPGSTSASVQIWFRAGSALEKKDNQGIAHFLEHMFFKGTEKRPGAAIAHDVESFGGEINAFTSFDYTCYYINTPATELNQTTEILLDMVSNPRFLQEDLVPERGVVFEEYRRSIDNPNQFGFQKLQKSSFTGGYAHPILGNEKTILSFTQDQLKDFRKDFYNLSNSLLVVAGDLKKKKDIIKTIEAFKLPQGPRSSFPNFKLKNTSTIDIHEKDTHMVQMSLCLQAPIFEDGDAPKEDLAINCLGHGESSRLYQNLVAQTSLATSSGSFTMFMNKGGLHYIKLLFPIENLTKVLSSFEKLLIESLKDGLTPDEVQKIKNQYVASKVYDMESLESYAFSLGQSFASTGDIGSEEEFIQRVRKTTVAEVNDSLRRIFKRPLHLSVQLPSGTKNAQREKQIQGFQKRLETKLKGLKSAHPKLSKAITSKFDPQVKLFEIKPGVKLLYRQNTMNPTFVMHAYLKGGITEEKASNNGLYQMISSTITKGYSKVDYSQLKNELDHLSASLHAFSGKNAYGLTLHGQSEHFKKLLNHFVGTLTEPSFKAAHIKHEKEMAFRMIKNHTKDPVKLCFRAVSESLFGGHPYAMPVIGTEQSVKRLSSKLVKETHQSNLKNNEILLTYCGDKSFDEVYHQLEPFLDKLPSRRKKAKKARKAKPIKGQKQFIEFDREQTQIFTGIPTDKLDSKEHLPLKMLTTHLSGQSSELFVEVRDRQGLCYTAQPIHFSALEAGYWGIYMASGHDKVEPALKAIREIIENIRLNGLSKKEFSRVKKMIAGQSLLNVQTNDDYANIYSVTTLQGFDLDHYHLSNKEIERLSYESFSKEIKKILGRTWSTVIVGREKPNDF